VIAAAKPKRRRSTVSSSRRAARRAAGPSPRRPASASAATGVPSPLSLRRSALFDRKIDYIPCRLFLRKDAERLATEPPADAALPLERSGRDAPRGAGLPPYLASLYQTRLLTRDEEQFYFRRMNWLKFRAATLRGGLDRRRASLRQIERIEELLAEADTVKAILITSNLRLVVSIAKKFVDATTGFDELVGEGNVALIRSVEKFNFALGNRFSTYATYAIQRHFFRLSHKSRQQRQRFVSDDESFKGRAAPEPVGERCSVAQVEILKEVFGRFLSDLEPREQEIVVARFGFDGQPPRTFRELGAAMGVCKERIRQIQSRAMDKLREMAAGERLEQTVGDWL
jgi:RNA polymerase sigma factor (sigma-70 family)